MSPPPPPPGAAAPADDPVARVLADTQGDVIRLARALMLGLGVPLTGLILGLAARARQEIWVWQWAELVAMVLTPALLFAIPADRLRARAIVLVVGLGLATLCGIFHSGPGLGVGIVYCGWVIAAVFFTGGVTVPTVVGGLLMLTLWLGDGHLPLGFPWVSGRSNTSWLFSLLTVVGTTLGIASAFRMTLTRLRRAVSDEARARDAALRAQHEREDALGRAAQAQRLEALGRLAGGVAHDFNNAIAIISLGVDELREPLAAPEREQVLQDMRRATRGAEATTRQLLAFARQGSAPGSRAAPDAVVRGMASALRRLLPESVHIVVHAVPVGDVSMAVGDLEQAVLNLCLNARDAMPDGGTLTMHVWATPAREAVVEVVDTGMGMSADVRARALDPFFTTKGEGRGTGLGLAMVGASVQRAGGSVEIDSGEGLGTTVRLRLPLAVPVVPAESAAQTPATAPPRGHVLVLEDEPQLQRLLERGLRRAGHQVTVAGTVGDALMALEAAPTVDLLLTDAVLPDGAPTRLIQAYRARSPGAPVLVCSGYVPSPDLIAGIEANAYAFLQKPFDSAALLASVTPLLERAGRVVPVG